MTVQDERNVSDNSRAIRVDTTKYMQQGYAVAIDNRQCESVSSFKWELNNYEYIGYKLLVSSTV
jgi:hypothetical protein